MPQLADNDKDGSLLLLWLPEDTFSLLVIGRHPLTIGISVAVMTVQLLIVTMLLADLIHIQDSHTAEEYTPHNPLKIPAAVTVPVAIAQFIALLVTLVSVDNVTWALLVHWNNGRIQDPARVGYHQWLTLRHRHHPQDHSQDDHDDNDYDTVSDSSMEQVPLFLDHKDTSRHDHHSPFPGEKHEEEKEEEREPHKPETDEELALLSSSHIKDEESLVNSAPSPVVLTKEPSPLVSSPSPSSSSSFSFAWWFPFVWYGSNGLRCLEGCASFLATFLLIVTSETVVDVLLTFSAIHFVSYLDNVVFWLARVGYFGRTVQTEALHPLCCNANFTAIPALMRPKLRRNFQRQGGGGGGGEEEDFTKTNDSGDTQSSVNKKRKQRLVPPARRSPFFCEALCYELPWR